MRKRNICNKLQLQNKKDVIEKMGNLTNSQKSIWVIEQYYKGSSINNICGTALINEKIDFEKLKKSIEIVCQKHDNFRMQIKIEDEGVRQVLSEPKEIQIDTVKVASKKELEEERKKIVRTPFKLENSELFKFYIFKFENGEGAFMLNIHHLISDAWTLAFICNEIIKTYSALKQNKEIETKAIYSYIDYIKSEKQYQESEKYQKDKKYWKEQFSTIPEVATIYGSKGNIDDTNPEGERKQFSLDIADVEEIKEYCKINKISLYNFFMAVYSIYIGEISNLDDFVIGTPILNRTNFKEKNAAGMFINTAPFRINVKEDIEFKEFIKNIAINSLNMLKHQKYSYQCLLEDLREKDKDIPNLYNILLSYQITNAQMSGGDIKYKTEWTFNGCCAENMDIQIYDLNDTGSLNIAYDYKTSIYEQTDIEKIHQRILYIIKQVISKQQIQIKDIEIVTPEEKKTLVKDFNKTELKYDRKETVIGLFEKQVEKTPEKVAIKSNHKKLTYKILNEKANMLAREMLNKGVKQHDIVGIMVNRSPEMIIGLIAILKCGATYLPIDPEYPEERVTYMLENSETKFVLVNNKTEKYIPDKCSKIDVEKVENNNTANINLKINENSLVYLIYTSGSTGKPKGVRITNKNLNNFIKGMKNLINFDSNKTMVSVTTICFDIFGLEMWCSLTSGMTLVVANEVEQNTPALLNKLCLENKVNMIQTTPSRYSVVFEDKSNLRFLENVTEILIGGEAISNRILENMKENTKARIFNMYGPTETTIWSTVKELTKTEEITIGKPIANTQCYILNQNHKLLPCNVPGELYIGGDGVSNGYLKREDLNEEKFIKSPFRENRKIYNTNDLAYYKENGEIVHLGRTDFQVKIRGFRVELGEIENAIEKNENVNQAVVVKRKLQNGHEALIAYYTNNNANIGLVKKIKEDLEKELPQYMVPQYFVKLEKMPYTPNGKIDRKMLPEPDVQELNKIIVKPRNELDKELIKIIAKMLRTEQISLNDTILNLGGDSLTAITLSTKILSKFNVQINIKDILSGYTIKDISDSIRENQAKGFKKIKISKAPKQEVYELSSAQKRIYYNSKMIGEDNTVYNMPGGIIVDEILDKEKVKKVFAKIIERHSTLRTGFIAQKNNVVQKIKDKLEIEIPVYYDTGSELKKIIDNFPRPFKLEKEPLIRVELHYIDNRKTLLLVDSHHIIMDGTSLNNLIIEFERLYNGENLKRIPIQYKDYAVWENKFNESESIKEYEKYWINKFKDAELSQLNLPYDYKIPTNRNYAGKKISNVIDRRKFRKIERYAKKIGASPYMLFISAFFVLLYKYTGQEEITLGSPYANREINETKRVIGMFVNNIVVKANMNSELTFQEFLDSMKEQILDDISNQPYPFDMLVKKLGIKVDNSRNPLFDVMFTYQNKEENILRLDDKETQIIEIENDISKFNLSLEIKPKTNTINIEYCTDLFKRQTIEKLFEHYMNVIDNIILDSNKKIKNIDIISEEEKNKILYEFNATEMDYPKDKTISQLFEEQVEKTPNKIAIVFENKKLTYKELNEKANQLANYLRKSGIKPNDIVGIMLPRSLELLISIIGVLKSGACYIPIDPTYPEKRIEYMLDNSESKILITTNELYNNIKFENKILINDNEILIQEKNNLEKINSPEDMVYIIYTSGSTGLPKGVVLKHKSLSNLCTYLNGNVEFLKEECEYKNIASITTVSFDIFIFETLVCLQKGLKIILANEEEQRIPALLDKLIGKNDVQIIQMTPSRMQIFLDNIKDMPNLSNLKYVTLAGEALPLKLRDELIELGVEKIYNGYGPSETTVFSTFTDVTDSKEINIGTPLGNTQAYILDNNLNIVPIGVAGELYISGEGVGKGYLNREDITKERYIKNPFIENSIMYKTGDVCKFDRHGKLHYLGRADNQVKIRGLRIELEEIENRMLEFPNIKKAKVIKQTIGDRDVISAYYIASKNVISPELRKYLYSTLPNYMVPSYFTEVEAYPYTPNGKIDKNTLAEMINLDEANKEIIQPRNEIERKVANIFKKVLEVKEISIDDNFFELGGDSISAMKLQIEATRENLNITYGNIFKYSTTRSLAENIQRISGINNTIPKSEEREYYPVSSAQKRMYIVSNMDENSDTYNINGGILLNSSVNIEKLQKAMDKIVEKNNILRTYFEVQDNGEIVQKIADDCTVKIHVNYAKNNDIQEIFEETKKIFNLGEPPLLDANLFLLPNGKTLLTLNVHHIIIDGTSLKLMLQELTKSYDGKDIKESSISYKDFAVWEEKQLLEDKFRESKQYWKKQFEDGIPILNMPSTYSRPPIKSFEGETLNIKITRKLTEKIIEYCKEKGITPYMFLLTCYYILLYKYTGQESIIVGSPISGRTYKELEDVLGMFVNTLPIKNDIFPEENFEGLLDKVKENLLNAYSHQNYPFDSLVNELNIPRDNSRTPLFDTMFIYQNDMFSTVEFNGENAKYCIPETHTSKYDLSVETILIDDEFNLSFEYWTKLFDEEFIKRLSSHYINLISSVIENKNMKICDISILDKREKKQILYNFNDTKMEYNKDQTIIQLFEKQVKLTPNNTAIVFEDSSITYKELNEKANQLARYLINEGIGVSSVVGIMLPRGMEVLVSMIAVLKTGASYIPIDPELPQNRIEYMLSNSQVACLLVKQIDMNQFKIKQLNVSLENKDIYKGKSSNINLEIDTETPAYMIYTSGSTGVPKGVVLKHKSLTNLTNFLNQKVKFLEDRYSNIAIASITTISFDIFIFETLICLQRGLKIVMANEKEQNTPTLLENLIEKNDVKAIQMTPSRMYIFINNKNLMPHLKNLEYVVLAGETLPKDLRDRITLLGDITIYNGYGPSETTVFSTFTDVSNYDEITIGKPLANTRIYILDNDKNICPIGHPGEIYIAGDGVGIGYCNNEKMTKERFIQDVFYKKELMYKTGDLGKYLPTGEISYIGRVDNQIKIRGLRIELDEIEKCILKYQNIDKCIVTGDTDEKERQFIVAYVTVTDRISTNKLREFLKTLLPKYMIPSYFVVLDKIPYLNNGKINKKALPKVDITCSQDNKTEYIAPRGNLELQLVNVFQNILSISPIGIDDNFFELGGDSLLAINLQVELMKLKINVTYPEIFENPTVRELALRISTAEKNTFKVIDKEEFSEFNKILENTCNEVSKIEKTDVGNIFITGVTGFLGAHVLDAFLTSEKGIAYCAIRTEPGLTLENKLLNKLHFYFGNKYDDYLGKRIIIVNSNLSQNELGMTSENIEKIFDNIDCIINCAAKVSHYGNYNDYKKINVNGTENLLKLCMKYNKRFYQISTLSVSGNSLVDQSYIEQSFEHDVIFKENNFYINQSLDNVYVRSKFEAEKLVLQYINKGLNGYICRVGNLMSRYNDGKFQSNVNENAFIGRLISLSKIGCIPDYLLNTYMEFTPIDCCAQAIIKLLQYPTNENRIFHLYNNNHVNIQDFINVLKKYTTVNIVDNEEFLKKVDKLLTQKDFSNILSGVLRDFDENKKLVYESKVKLDAEFSNKYLSKIKFKWPKIDNIYLEKFIDYFYSIGYITKEEK